MGRLQRLRLGFRPRRPGHDCSRHPELRAARCPPRHRDQSHGQHCHRQHQPAGAQPVEQGTGGHHRHDKADRAPLAHVPVGAGIAPGRAQRQGFSNRALSRREEIQDRDQTQQGGRVALRKCHQHNRRERTERAERQQSCPMCHPIRPGPPKRRRHHPHQLRHGQQQADLGDRQPHAAKYRPR